MEYGALAVPRGMANADVYVLGSDVNAEGASDEMPIAEFSPMPLVLPIADWENSGFREEKVFELVLLRGS